METKNFWGRLCPKLPRIYTGSMTALLLCAAPTLPALAAHSAGQGLGPDVRLHVSADGDEPGVLQEELQAEINADREAHGEKPFDDEGDPPRQPKRRGQHLKKEAGAAEEGRLQNGGEKHNRPGLWCVCEGETPAAVCL